MTLGQELKSGAKTNVSEVDRLLERWPSLSESQQKDFFLFLEPNIAEELFLRLDARDQAELLGEIPDLRRRSWIRIMAPDDVVDLVQALEPEDRPKILNDLDLKTRAEVVALLAYEEDKAGGLMSSRFVRLRPEMTVEEAIRYLRAQTRSNVETVYYAYVLDLNQVLLGVVSLRQLFTAPSDKKIIDIMVKGDDLITIPDDMDQEHMARIFSNQEHLALPVLDAHRVMKGIITLDDVVQVVKEEATEDIHKMGGMEAIDEPYFRIHFLTMVRKRAGWLLALFIGELFTATAMSIYEKEIAQAVVLALFIPLVISSGGNSGSQATTLIIRAMALGEVRLKDFVRVFVRELSSGLMLGLILGAVGFCRVLLWPTREATYGVHYGLIALTVGGSLVGVVTWGTLVGSMLPFALRKLKFDPAAASAPFVATIVDVTGLVIYFSIARLILSGVML